MPKRATESFLGVVFWLLLIKALRPISINEY